MKHVSLSVFMGIVIAVLVLLLGVTLIFVQEREEGVRNEQAQVQVIENREAVSGNDVEEVRIGYAQAVDTGSALDIPYLTNGFTPGIHFGIDISAENQSSNIISLIDGTVMFAGYCVEEDICDGSGNAVIVEQEDGIQVLYAHLDSFVVNVGDVVSVGQKLGVMGTTGRSTGSHVHVQVCKSDCSDTSAENLIDPQTLFFPENLN